jgi:hypothetical protein
MTPEAFLGLEDDALGDDFLVDFAMKLHTPRDM